MASEHQLSMLSRGPLFERRVLEQYLVELRTYGIPQEAEKAKAVAKWLTELEASKGTKETALEQAFNHKILGDVLGYRLYPAADASAWPKTDTSVTGIAGEPDVTLGHFSEGQEPEFTAVLELKGPKVGLDKPATSGKTPVQQAFEYGEQILGVSWVLVSNMRVIRLYSVESPNESMIFDLAECVSGDKPNAKFRELWGLLSHERLVADGEDSAVARLRAKSVSRQLEIRDSFYEAYYKIRADLLGAIADASKALQPPPNRDEILTATQRLLDRMLFIYYCEDTPGALLPPDTVKHITEAARGLPGPSPSKVYSALKALFREVDQGSPATNVVKLDGYNGELFKLDRIIDHIDLPDSLHDELYAVQSGEISRKIRGVWGLHAFDFWRELNEHLLGHIFEQSLSDIIDMLEGEALTPDRLAERRRHGIYYTSELLSDFLCEKSVEAILRETAPTSGASTQTGLAELLEQRREKLGDLRILDLAAGSGAFLVSSYQALLQEFWQTRDALDALSGGADDLLTLGATLDQSKLLRESLHAVDLLPQAIEITKLALWLRSARKGEKVPDLSDNLVAHNSLDVPGARALLKADLHSFDMVVGNPPWGGEVADDVLGIVCDALGLNPDLGWDSFELFVALGLAFLREGGRLAYVLPDTIFSPEKEKTRRLLLEAGTVERFHNLGPDWFDDVRMGTVVVQVRRGPIAMGSTFRSVLLAGGLRKKAIQGKLPLSQIETTLGRDIPQDRCLSSPTAEIEVFRSVVDDAIIGQMLADSTPLAQLCERGRGEEMSKAGLLWVCPSCFTTSVPATKRKADPRNPGAAKYNSKACPECGLELDESSVSFRHLVTAEDPERADPATTAPYIDGDDLTRRWQAVRAKKVLHRDLKGFPYKADSFYEQPKILVRKTGVGMLATYDTGGARFPQTVFFYRLKPGQAAVGYQHEFVLAALLSRTMSYLLFKRYAQVDPSRGHAHVTHERLKDLPIPRVDFSDSRQRRLHDRIVAHAQSLLAGEAELGHQEDMEIDLMLRELWGLSGEDGLHINLELAQVPEGQVMRDLFPDGLPRQILTTANAESDRLVATVST